jgi:Na+-translocating ferredoxin:NAD+ oxidoreductase RnfE subunit
MLKIAAYILTANLFISTFYQLVSFCSKAGDQVCTTGLVIFGLGGVLLILNLLTTSSMFFLGEENNNRLRKPLKIISIITLAFTITFLLSFFPNHFMDCLLLLLPLLLINGLVIVLSFSEKLRTTYSDLKSF